ncbi:sirohydrochlorin chelatase [Staphylococcus agnetis]|uniref:Sirohydrochlorin chelatase n=1 Tax=Staphylococcus agnetis TaxID=985762 RepID=A0ABD7TVN5_9STAP|nr:sirohydrochlorin chelatase [Staphylococcus agnetis]UXU57682.1 sirohydrochlorin chelatase [Staphylococcus agnetis]
MHKTILVVHGMRKGKLNETLLNFIHRTFNDNVVDYDVAFLESETIQLDEVIQNNIDAGYQRIHLIPLLLFSASHYYEDIQAICETFNKRESNLQLVLGKPLGTHPMMTQWVESQIDSYQHEMDASTGIVLFAHGNARFSEPDIALTEICDKLSTPTRPCYPSMVYGDYTFTTTLPQIAQKHHKLIIIPFFFYDGYLVNKSKRRIQELNLPNTIVYTSAINFHPVLEAVIRERMAECEEVPHVSHSIESCR